MNNTVKTDVLIIGAGPSGLATAIHLADLLKTNGIEKQIIVVDKGQSVGSHILSGAVIKPQAFRDLLPDVNFDEIPFDGKVVSDEMYFLQNEKSSLKVPFHPPYMGNSGNYCASLGEICRYLAAKATEKGVDIYPGFSMSDILYDEKGDVAGAKCIDTGIDHDGNKLENFVEGTRVEASITIFAEGTRGSLAKKLIEKKNLQQGRNPQIYSLGVKELFSVPEGTIKAGEVYHTMGFPAMNDNVFGGGFIYGLKDNKVAVGMVLGLDFTDPTYDIYHAFQIWKTHPFVEKFVKDGKILEYGAKTVPEGGYYSLTKYFLNNAMIVGDSAGFLAMPALKGIHLSIYSGMSAAKAAYDAFVKNDFSKNTLKNYEQYVQQSPRFCRQTRYAQRLSFDKDGRQRQETAVQRQMGVVRHRQALQSQQSGRRILFGHTTRRRTTYPHSYQQRKRVSRYKHQKVRCSVPIFLPGRSIRNTHRQDDRQKRDTYS